MILLLILLAAPVQAAVGGATAATAVPELDLARARVEFAEADADGSERVEPLEGQVVGVSPYAFRALDADGSGALDQAEFIVGARMRAASERRRVACDLDAEVTRILASRRARAAELRRRVEPGGKAQASGATHSGKEALRTEGPGKARLRSVNARRVRRAAKADDPTPGGKLNSQKRDAAERQQATPAPPKPTQEAVPAPKAGGGEPTTGVGSTTPAESHPQGPVKPTATSRSSP